MLPASLAGASALVGVLVYAPGVLDLINAVTGSGPILWRMLYVAPVPVLVGLLVALPWATADRTGDGHGAGHRAATSGEPARSQGSPRSRRLRGWAAGRSGPTPATGDRVTVSSRPEWKLDLEALGTSRSSWPSATSAGTVLLPPRRMKVLTMYTTEAFPVVPREWFIENMRRAAGGAPRQRMLYEVADGEGPFPSEGNVRKALEQLEVTLACVETTSKDADRVLELYQAGGLSDARGGRRPDLPTDAVEGTGPAPMSPLYPRERPPRPPEAAQNHSQPRLRRAR